MTSSDSSPPPAPCRDASNFPDAPFDTVAFCYDVAETVGQGISAGCAPAELREVGVEVTPAGMRRELDSLRAAKTALGVRVIVATTGERGEHHPDQHYVQDQGVLLRYGGSRVIVSFQPGDERRRRENDGWVTGISRAFPDAKLVRITEPHAWFESGDLFNPIRLDGVPTFFAGVRQDRITSGGPTIRTVRAGLDMFRLTVRKFGYAVVEVPFLSTPESPLLHFTTGGSALGRNRHGEPCVILNPFNFPEESQQIFRDHGVRVLTPKADSPRRRHLWAVNCVALNGSVIYQDEPEIARTLRAGGFDADQLRAIPPWIVNPQNDGSLTCTFNTDYVID